MHKCGYVCSSRYMWVRFCYFLSCQYIGIHGFVSLFYFTTLIIFSTADNVIISDIPGLSLKEEVGIEILPIDIKLIFF